MGNDEQTQPTTQPAVELQNVERRARCLLRRVILADDGVDITADKLQTIIKAAKIDDVEPLWTSLFAKALEGKDVKDLLLNVGSGGGAAAAPAAGGAAGGEAAAEET